MISSIPLSLQSLIRGCFVILLICVMTIFLGEKQAHAHKPDRCFHKHYGGSTQCNKRIPGKKCTDAKGNKGKCVQGSSYCYCKLYSSKKRNQSSYDERDDEEKRDTARKILELGIGIGNELLERERRRRHRDDEDYERDDRGRDRDY